ncbi:MAG TPA: hypothetical protein VF605_12705 [Allosphingosinicella sp.]|jgi:uncharacterized cupredoxin-like copper-binding protein
MMAIRRLLLAAMLAAGTAAAPASAQVDSFLFGKPLTKTVAPGVFEVTARGKNMRERRSSYEMALIKAAKRAAKAKGTWFAVLREKSGTWTMNGGPIGDETTIRFKLVSGPDPIADDKGAPARVYNVAEILSRSR